MISPRLRSALFALVALVLTCLCAPQSARAQSWQAIPETGNPMPNYVAWNYSIYDTQHQLLLEPIDDANDSGGIYMNSMWNINPTTGAWLRLWLTPALSSPCPGDSTTFPNNRHTYGQATWDSFRNQLYISSGSCQGGLGYDWYAFSNQGTMDSGAWTEFPNPTNNPGLRQEGAMVYMPNIDRVLLYGGYSGLSGSTSDDSWELNPSTNTWTMICNPCTDGLRHAHILVYDPPSGKVILFGGERSFNGANIADTYLYNPLSHTWAPANPTVEAPPQAYTCFGYDLQRNRLLIYPSTGPIYSYTTASNTWTTLNIANLTTSSGPAPDPNGGGVGTQTTSCGYDSLHDWFMFFGYPPDAVGPPIAYGVNFGHPLSPSTAASAVITAPARDASVTGQVPIAATVNDPSAVSSVQFQVDGVNVGTAVTAPPYVTSWDTTKLANGRHLIAALVSDASPNGKFATPTSAATVANGVAATPDFSLSLAPATATVTSKQNATYALTLSPTAGFNQTVTFACAGAPANTTCSISPSSASISAATVVQITVSKNATPARAFVLPTPRMRGRAALVPDEMGAAWPLWLCALVVAFMVARRRVPRMRRVAPAMALVVLAVGCGGGGSGGASGGGRSSGGVMPVTSASPTVTPAVPSATPGTPGAPSPTPSASPTTTTSTLTITATSSTANGTITHSTTATLVVSS